MDVHTNIPLKLYKPKSNVGFIDKTASRNLLLEATDPALNLLTDFRLTPAISVLATTQIDQALTQMICSRVRLLFVVDPVFSLLGAITSYDIQGEKPLRYLQSRDCRIGICSRDDILVQDIMAPVNEWRVVNYQQLINATIADLILTFQELGQRHLIVVEPMRGRNGQTVRGLISLTDLERALETSIQPVNVAESFAEIRRELAK